MGQDVEALAQAAEQFARETGIPPCPAVVTKLLRETREEEPDLKRIGQLVSGDAGLAGAVLNLVNSSYYGLRVKAASIHQALTFLGVTSVSQIVTRLVLRQAFATAGGAAAERYWRRSMATAMIGALVARQSRRADAEVAQTYLLFRDCGMLLLLQRSPAYADIMDGHALVAGADPLALEVERYGVHHAAIGTHLAQTWQLPHALCAAIEHHHGIQGLGEQDDLVAAQASALVAAGLAADKLYADAGGLACPEWAGAEQWVRAKLALPEDALEALAGRVAQALGKAR